MGRGRQKAKQTKVARQLKYYSPQTDYASLERELSRSPARTRPIRDDDDRDEDVDDYGSWAAGDTR